MPSAPQYTQDNQYKNDLGYQNRMTYGGEVGGADAAASHYQQMGNAGNQRGAYQGDYSGFNYGMNNAQGARGQQQDALSLQRMAAMGQAPSAAEISGQAAMQGALSNQVAAAGSARGGPMQQAAAMNSASKVNAANQAQMTAGIQAGRANEMAQARGSYQAGASDIRGQDYGGAGLNLQQVGQQQQNEQFQRGLNQQNQQYYEGLGNQVNTTQLGANLAAQQGANAAWGQGRDATMKDEQFGFGKIMAGIGAGASALGGGAAVGAAAGGGKPPPETGSDERMKNLAMTDPSGGMALASGGGLDVMGSLKKMSALETNPRYENAIAKDPSGGMMMRSDADAKQEAHDLGYIKGLDAASPSKSPAYDESGDIVAGKRARGEYAAVDSSPISDEALRRSDMHRAMAAETEGADPYGGAPSRMPETEPQAGAPPWLKVLGGALGGVGHSASAAGHDYRYAPQASQAYSDENAKDLAYNLGRAHQMESMSPAGRKTPFLYPTHKDLADEDIRPMHAREAAMERELAAHGQAEVSNSDADRMVAHQQRDKQQADARLRGWREVEGPPGPRSPPQQDEIERARGAESPATPAPAPSASERLSRVFSLEPVRKMVPSDERTKDRGASAVSDVEKDANRKMAAQPYSYKPEFLPPEQAPGEMNYGPMAQNLEKNPITATTVRKDGKGMRLVDMVKLEKVHSGAIANLQSQLDELRYGRG